MVVSSTELNGYRKGSNSHVRLLSSCEEERVTRCGRIVQSSKLGEESQVTGCWTFASGRRDREALRLVP